MPNYAFKCECGHHWEVTLPVKNYEKPLKSKCPSCKMKGKITRDYSNGTAGLIIDTMPHKTSVTGGWKETLQKVKAKHPRGNYGRMGGNL